MTCDRLNICKDEGVLVGASGECLICGAEAGVVCRIDRMPMKYVPKGIISDYAAEPLSGLSDEHLAEMMHTDDGEIYGICKELLGARSAIKNLLAYSSQMEGIAIREAEESAKRREHIALKDAEIARLRAVLQSVELTVLKNEE
jgi:hypothetical protein